MQNLNLETSVPDVDEIKRKKKDVRLKSDRAVIFDGCGKCIMALLVDRHTRRH